MYNSRGTEAVYLTLSMTPVRCSPYREESERIDSLATTLLMPWSTRLSGIWEYMLLLLYSKSRLKCHPESEELPLSVDFEWKLLSAPVLVFSLNYLVSRLWHWCTRKGQGLTVQIAIHNRLKPGKWNGALSERNVADDTWKNLVSLLAA